jgi:hypothetical protein
MSRRAVAFYRKTPRTTSTDQTCMHMSETIQFSTLTPWGKRNVSVPKDSATVSSCYSNSRLGGVKLEIEPPSKKWSATTRKNKITVYGSCQAFVDDPETVLEEYYHVLEQWNKGRLSRLKYNLADLFHGYNNKYEKEAKTWVQKNLESYMACLAR